jgi:catechol 2,3-dioxygenase-like lactoylglutathione lyase family enzyme
MTKTMWMGLAVAGALAASLSAASAEPIPGMLGHDHTGVTVPNIKEAITFFTDIVGCKEAMSFGPFSDDKGTFMQDLLNVHPRAKIQQITMMRCGNGSNIELFQYESPDQQNAIPKNSDIGGHHIAFYVEDINAAAKYLKDKGVRTLMGPLPVEQGPAAGQAIIYFFAPWGLQLELISYPNGMAYEKDGGTILWTPKDPGK